MTIQEEKKEGFCIKRDDGKFYSRESRVDFGPLYHLSVSIANETAMEKTVNVCASFPGLIEKDRRADPPRNHTYKVLPISITVKVTDIDEEAK
jgi:hypothetical protein